MRSWNIVSIWGSDKWEFVRCVVSFYVAESEEGSDSCGSFWRRTNCLVFTTLVYLVCEPTTEDLHHLISEFASVGCPEVHSAHFTLMLYLPQESQQHAGTCDLKYTLSCAFSSTSIPERDCISAQSKTAGSSMHLLGLGRQKKKHMSHNWSWSV